MTWNFVFLAKSKFCFKKWKNRSVWFYRKNRLFSRDQLWPPNSVSHSNCPFTFNSLLSFFICWHLLVNPFIFVVIVVINDQKLTTKPNDKTINQKHNLTVATFQLLSLILMQPQQNTLLLCVTTHKIMDIFLHFVFRLVNNLIKPAVNCTFHMQIRVQCAKKWLSYLLVDPLLLLSSVFVTFSQLASHSCV